ncbi:MAG: hypothetical protein IKO49_06450, partial [Bacilli bacterium]|nr:hypothetical protein [Bacilli bacterium]
QIKSGSVTGENVTTAPTTTGTTTTEVTYAVILPEPGDFYEFTVDAVNAGTIDAMIAENGVSNIAYTDSTYETVATLPKVLKYTVTYADGSAIEDYHLLAKKSGSTPTTEKYKVRVEYRNDDEINISDLEEVTADTTYYFKFSVKYVQADSSAINLHPPIICKKATTLKTEACERTDSNGCRAKGYAQGATITYGHTNGTSLVNGQSGGYALDCDVSGNGDYERFYYVSDLYTGTENGVDQFDSDYAVLIYHKNIGTSGVAYYYENNMRENWHGPVTLLSLLPTRSTWTNKNLSLKSTSRTIHTETGTTETINHTIENPFVYTDRVARLLTTQEINKSCNITAGSYTDGELAGCEYLMEDTDYSRESECSGGSCYYWLETPRWRYEDHALYIYGKYRKVDTYFLDYPNGVRPAIEVLKSNISLEE